MQGGKREFIRPFYEQYKAKWRVRPEGDIRVVIQDILAQLAPDWHAKYLREVSESLAHLVRELIENSDWWARADHRGVEYDKGIRAVTFRLIDIEFHQAINDAAANPLLSSLAQVLYDLGLDVRRMASEMPGVISKSVGQHIVIADAMLIEDASAARVTVPRTAKRTRGRGRDTELLFIGVGRYRVSGRGRRSGRSRR